MTSEPITHLFINYIGSGKEGKASQNNAYNVQ